MSLLNRSLTNRRALTRVEPRAAAVTAEWLKEGSKLALKLGLISATLVGCNLFAGSSDPAPELQQLQGGSESQPSAQGLANATTAQDAQEAASGEPQPDKEAGPSKIVAKVNQTEITRSAYEALFEEQVRPYRIQKKSIPPKTEKRHRAAALQKLIDRELLTQYFAEFKYELSDEERQEAFNGYKARFKGEQSFQRFLSRSNKSEAELRAQAEFDLLTEKALKLNFKDDLEISPEQISAFYDQYRERKFVKPARVRVSHLLVAAPSSAGKRVIRKQKSVARKLYKQAKRGDAKAFAQLVREHSADLSTRQQGGDLNYFTRKGLPMISEEFERAAAKLKIGEISEPVRTERGYHLIRLTNRQPAQVRASHILLSPQATEADINKIKKRAATESFAQLARELSKDESTRLRGGELGFIHAQRPHRYGDTFKTACLSAKEGELVGPIFTAKGKHLIYITGRRSERLRVGHILVALPKRAKRAQKREALEKIKKIAAELKKSSKTSGSLFVRLAKKYSDDATRDRGGDLGSFYVGGDPKISHSFEEAAFKGKVGAVTKPVLSPYGWHLIFVHDHQDRIERSLDSVRDEITDQLLDKGLRRVKSRLIKELRRNAKIERFETL